MKILVLLLVCFYSSVSLGQDSTADFELTFTTFNHAERIHDGTTTYVLTESTLKVMKTYLFDPKSKTVFSKSIRRGEKLVLNINNVRLDSLEDFYYNFCIMGTSGNEYFLDLKNVAGKKSISLHHYYLKQLEDLILLMNEYLPNRHRIHYLSKDTEQGCTLQ